jgi:hypothetical protein
MEYAKISLRRFSTLFFSRLEQMKILKWYLRLFPQLLSPFKAFQAPFGQQ